MSEFDKDEVFKRWRETGVAPSGLEGLWKLAEACRKIDDYMDGIPKMSETEQSVAFRMFWQARGIHYTALSYLCDQRVLRAKGIDAIKDFRTGEEAASDPELVKKILWIDGLATGIDYAKFDPVKFFPILDGSISRDS
jgi:hypothetical protein